MDANVNPIISGIQILLNANVITEMVLLHCQTIIALTVNQLLTLKYLYISLTINAVVDLDSFGTQLL